jgi:hypothetical protein
MENIFSFFYSYFDNTGFVILILQRGSGACVFAFATRSGACLFLFSFFRGRPPEKGKR